MSSLLLVSQRSFKQQLTIIDRIKACHNPKITPANKPKMEVKIKRDSFFSVAVLRLRLSRLHVVEINYSSKSSFVTVRVFFLLFVNNFVCVTSHTNLV